MEFPALKKETPEHSGVFLLVSDSHTLGSRTPSDFVGLRFAVWKFIIDFNKKILTPINGNDGKLGRHLKKIDFDVVEHMKAEGMTNTQIYKQLGVARSTYYLKLKEYNQNL